MLEWQGVLEIVGKKELESIPTSTLTPDPPHFPQSVSNFRLRETATEGKGQDWLLGASGACSEVRSRGRGSQWGLGSAHHAAFTSNPTSRAKKLRIPSTNCAGATGYTHAKE